MGNSGSYIVSSILPSTDMMSYNMKEFVIVLLLLLSTRHHFLVLMSLINELVFSFPFSFSCVLICVFDGQTTCQVMEVEFQFLLGNFVARVHTEATK